MLSPSQYPSIKELLLVEENRLQVKPFLEKPIRPNRMYYGHQQRQYDADLANWEMNHEIYQEHAAACAATSFPLIGQLPLKEVYTVGEDVELVQQLRAPKGEWFRCTTPRVFDVAPECQKRVVAVPLSPVTPLQETKEEILTPEILTALGFVKWGRDDIPATVYFEKGVLQLKWYEKEKCFGWLWKKANENNALSWYPQIKIKSLQQLQTLHAGLYNEHLSKVAAPPQERESKEALPKFLQAVYDLCNSQYDTSDKNGKVRQMAKVERLMHQVLKETGFEPELK